MPARLKEFLQRWAITTVAVLLAAHLLHPRIHYDTWQGLLLATLLLGLLNAFLKPLLLLLSLPLVVLTLGLFTLVINALLLFLVGRLMRDFHVESFATAFWGGLVISVVTVALNALTGTGNARVEFRRGRGPPRSKDPPDGPEGGGPVIDV
jgi:putative membrane protein